MRLAALVWVATVIVMRFISPPLTPLIAFRAAEYWLEGKPGIRAWEWRPISYYPTHVLQAVVAAEDARFFDHWGVDLSAVEDALDDSDGRSKPRGASTITMQTVKNIFLWPGRSYIRKAIEACMAPVAGILWGKKRTLELYVNVIEWGEGIYGLEAAAQYYFNRPANELSAREAAALAAILPSPRKLSPKSLGGASGRRFERIIRESPDVAVPKRWRKVSSQKKTD
jgi:monofunctional biosynthetic peptidoglycan transglycosylase